MAETLEKIRLFIKNDLGYEGQLGLDDDLLEEEILDSFSIVELAVYVQTSLDIDLEPDDLSVENFTSLSTIANLISERTS